MEVFIPDQNYPLDEHMVNLQGSLEDFSKIPLYVSNTMRKRFEKVYNADNKDIFLQFLFFDGKRDMGIQFATTYALFKSVESIESHKRSILVRNLTYFIAHYNSDDFHSFLYTKLQEEKFKDDMWNISRYLCSNEASIFFEGVTLLLDAIQNEKMKSVEENDLASRDLYESKTINDKMLISFLQQKGKRFFSSWSDEQRKLYRKKISKMMFFLETSLGTYEIMVESGNIVPKGTNVSAFENAIVQDEFNQIFNFLVKSVKFTPSGTQKKHVMFNSTLCLIAFSFDFNCVVTMRAAQIGLHKCIELYQDVDIVMRNKYSKELFCVLKKGNVFRLLVCNYCRESLLVIMRRFWELSSCDVFGEEDELNFFQKEVKKDIVAYKKKENIVKHIVKHIVSEDENLKLPLKKRKYKK